MGLHYSLPFYLWLAKTATHIHNTADSFQFDILPEQYLVCQTD